MDKIENLAKSKNYTKLKIRQNKKWKKTSKRKKKGIWKVVKNQKLMYLFQFTAKIMAKIPLAINMTF